MLGRNDIVFRGTFHLSLSLSLRLRLSQRCFKITVLAMPDSQALHCAHTMSWARRGRQCHLVRTRVRADDGESACSARPADDRSDEMTLDDSTGVLDVAGTRADAMGRIREHKCGLGDEEQRHIQPTPT